MMPKLKTNIPIETFTKKGKSLAHEDAGTILTPSGIDRGILPQDAGTLPVRILQKYLRGTAGLAYIQRKSLRAFRQEEHLSRTDLAKLFNVKVSQVARWLAPKKNDNDLIPILVSDLMKAKIYLIPKDLERVFSSITKVADDFKG
jgi:hypothetical protein